MGKTNKCDIREDESLAYKVQKYPCLYDKSDRGYKERDRKANAWREIEESLGYQEDTAGKKFDALKKKCYNKKKNALKGKRVSDTGPAPELTFGDRAGTNKFDKVTFSMPIQGRSQDF